MNVRELMRALVECNDDAEVVAVNLNDKGDEFEDTSKSRLNITSVTEIDESDTVAIYHIGDMPKTEEE